MSELDTSIRPVHLPARASDSTPTLTIVAGESAGTVWALGAREFTVGRGDDVELRLRDAGVSRRHAKFIVARDGAVTVIDLDSTNGTFVNDARVELCPLRPGDTVRIGPDALLRLGAPAPAPSPPADDTPASPGPLSPRELDVARLVATGLRNAEVAARLGLSARTITSHLDHIYARLGITSRAALTRHIIETGQLSPAAATPPRGRRR